MASVDADDSTLSHRGYESLLDAAETYREALVVRLCGAVGLRPTELAALTVDAVEQVRMDPPRYVIRVSTADDRPDRTAYLPTRVERELRRYVRSENRSAEDRIFPVTARRLQMLVSELSTRASERFDRPALADVSTSDLRHFFARTALVEHAVNPRVVKAAGGWRSFEALEPYLPEPTDSELVDAFEAAERPSARGRRNAAIETSDESVIRLLLAASDRYALLRLDADGYVERWNRSAAAMFGYRAGEIVGSHLSTFYPEDAVEDGAPERTLSTAIEESGHETDGWRLHEDGTRFRVTEVVSPLRDDRGQHRGFAVFVRDVSATYDELDSVRARRDELERSDAVARASRRTTQSLFDATDREEIEAHTCAALTDGRAYRCAWIDREPHSSRRTGRRAASEIDPVDIDRLRPEQWETDERATVEDAAISVATDVSFAGTVIEHETAESGAIARVPLRYGETVYGTLSVVTDRDSAFDPEERRWLETIGRHVGFTIAATRRRNLLLSDRVIELRFDCRDDGSFFVDASRRLGCRFELDSLVSISESTQLFYLRLEDASPVELFELAADDPDIDDCRLVETDEDGWRVEFVVGGSSPVLTLTEYGITVLDAVTEDGVTRLTAECAADADLRAIVTGLRSAFPDTELIGERETERAARTAREYREGLEDRLTDRQEASLRAAYFGGYYDWPRESTAEEIADAMGISSPTLHNHLRKGQHELLRTFFDERADTNSLEPDSDRA